MAARHVKPSQESTLSSTHIFPRDRALIHGNQDFGCTLSRTFGKALEPAQLILQVLFYSHMCTIFPFPQEDFSPYWKAAGYILYTSMSFSVSILPSQSPASKKLFCSCLRHLSHTTTSSFPGPLTVTSGWRPARHQSDPSLWGGPALQDPALFPVSALTPEGGCSFSQEPLQEGYGTFSLPSPGGLSAGLRWWDSDSAQSVAVPWLLSGPQTPLGQCLGCSVAGGQCRHGSEVAGGGGYTLEPWEVLPKSCCSCSALDFPPSLREPPMDRLFQYDRFCTE